MKYHVYSVDGERSVVESEKPLGLERLQELVGGYIEIVSLGVPDDPTVIAVINEEGAIYKLPINLAVPNFQGPVVLARLKGEEIVGLEP